MTIRTLMLTALFAGLLAAVGCVPKEDAPELVGPPAPKTTAELLVGKWKLVDHHGHLPEGFQATVEYTIDGKVIMWTTNPVERVMPQPEVQRGTYRLEGNMLFLAMGDSEGDRKLTIDVLTEDRFVNSGWIGREHQVDEFERTR